MLKRPHYIILGVVIVLTLVVLRLPSRTAAQLKLAVSGLFLPLFGLSDSTQRLADNAGTAVIPRKQLLQQAEQIRRENAELRLHVARAAEIERENARLRQALGLAREAPWKMRLARVVGRDPANWWKSIRIDLGSRHGVTTNCPVLTGDGLVGRVSEVNFAQSQVVLLGDPDCRVTVMVEDTRDNGIIAPASLKPLDSSVVDVSYLSRSSPLRPGQRVVTSGVGSIFPKGILVGQVIDWRSVGYGLYNEARIRLAVNMNNLEEVWVKLP